MQRLFSKLAILISGAFLLAACNSTVQQNNFPSLTFSHANVINLDVASIEIIPAYQNPLKAPHVEHEMPVALMQTMENWAKNTLKATGSEGAATVTISEASVIEEKLKLNEGFTSTFTTEQSERYTAKVTVDIDILTASGAGASTNATVTRITSVAEDISLVDREKVWFELVEKTSSDMHVKMQENIKKYLNNYIVP